LFAPADAAAGVAGGETVTAMFQERATYALAAGQGADNDEQ